MAESKIEWTGRSDWNPVRGCTRVSPGQRWEDNPWVVALTFRVVPGNIDGIAA